MALHGEMRVPNPAAQQRHVGNHRFHKPIVGTPQDLSVRRFLHPSAGVIFSVHQRRAGETLHYQQCFSQQDRGDDILRIKADICLGKGDKPVGKLLHFREALYIALRQRQPKGSHSLQDLVFAVAVDHPDSGPLSADNVVSADQITAAAHAEDLIETAYIFPVIA